MSVERSKYLPIQIAFGLMLGLFVARVLTEVARMPLPPLVIVVLAVVSCGVWIWLSRWLDRRGVTLPLVPALVLLICVLWPQRNWAVMTIVGAIALFSVLIRSSSRFTSSASLRARFYV